MNSRPANRGLLVAALIKQIPRFEELRLGSDGRLLREGSLPEINPYCRRALRKAVDIAQGSEGRSVVITMGPPQAEEALREALAVGADEAILVSDPILAGSDTLATSRVLAEVLVREGPFDLVLCGLNSVDADTGQVGPEVAELLGSAFVSGARTLEVEEGWLQARCERDDGWRDVVVELPAVVSVAERLCKPAKATLEQCHQISRSRIRRLCTADLGVGPWGGVASPTRVGSTRLVEVQRDRHRIDGHPDELADQVVEFLMTRGVLGSTCDPSGLGVVPDPSGSDDGSPIGVLLEPERPTLNRELLASAARLAHVRQARVCALGFEELEVSQLASWGADSVGVVLLPTTVEELCAPCVVDWVRETAPVTVLGPSTSWGREVMGRAAARLGVGLTGDAVAIEDLGGQVVYWKPAFGGQLLAAITCTSSTGLATLRPGVTPLLVPRKAEAVSVVPLDRHVGPGRVRVLAQERDDALSVITRARTVVGVGLGVAAEDYSLLEPLLKMLDAELAATRKVTDRGWLPRSSQLGVTGASIAPALYIAFGVSGSFNHMIGVRQASTVVAVNIDPHAPIFDQADLCVVADWRELVNPMTDTLVQRLGTTVVV